MKAPLKPVTDVKDMRGHIFERIGDRHNAAILYLDLAILYRDEIGDQEEARAHSEKARALFEIVGDARNTQRAALALRQL